jgi:hypothetical protein
MKHFSVSLNELVFIGKDLHRPECVLCTKSGTIYVSDWRGGVTRISDDGRQQSYLPKDTSIEIKPNGIALDRDGTFLIANLGDDGGVWRLLRDGTIQPVLLEIDGVDLPPSNFVSCCLMLQVRASLPTDWGIPMRFNLMRRPLGFTSTKHLGVD